MSVSTYSNKIHNLTFQKWSCSPKKKKGGGMFITTPSTKDSENTFQELCFNIFQKQALRPNVKEMQG